MSSFVMSGKSLSIIAHAIVRVRNSSYGDSLRVLLDKCASGATSRGYVPALFSRLLEFNIERVKIRHPDDDYEYDYNFVPCTPEVSLCQELKLMECYMCQCSEGHAYSASDVFRLVEKTAAAIRENIVDRLPEYKNARWSDIPDAPSGAAQGVRHGISQRDLW